MIYPSSISLGELESKKEAEKPGGYMTKAREAKKTVQCLDTYSELYKDIFPETPCPTVQNQFCRPWNI